MTEESILKVAKKEIENLLPILGNGMSYNDFIEEILIIMKEAMRKARREALRGN